MAESDPAISRACARAVNVYQASGDLHRRIVAEAEQADTVERLPEWILDPEPGKEPNAGR